MTKQFMSMPLQFLIQMGRNNRTGIHNGIAKRLGAVFLVGIDPEGIQTKRRITGCETINFPEHLTWINRQLPLRINLGFGERDAHQSNTILIWQQIQVVADMHRWHQESKLLR